ncbi:MAG: LuxR C-terminal-related transcriptional regulator [Thermomicrobiales bacterium]
MELLERAPELALLEEHLQAAVRGHGRLVMVGGEAGVGKSALVQTFAERAAKRATVLRASCEATSTPTPVGPTRDLAPALGLTLDLAQARGEEVFHAVLEALRSRSGPTIIIGEDAQWADSISLEFLRFMARRAAQVPVLFVITYRDDELGPDHPLRLMLGDLASSGVAPRLSLAPLSREGVGQLAVNSGRDLDELYQLTGGNPFFVNQVLSAEEGEIPATVTDAVLARAARLRTEARGVLDLCAVIGGRIDPDLVLAVAGPVTDELDACILHGLILAPEQTPYLRFRHDLIREAILAAIPPLRRRLLHGRVLEALLARGEPDVARLAHFAEAAGSPQTLEFATTAAKQAMARHAHREAADQYARALRFAGAASPETRTALCENHAEASQLCGRVESAISSRRQAVLLSAELGDEMRQGDNQRWLSRHLWFDGRGADAEQAARTAVHLLERHPPGLELAMAYSNLAQLCMLAYDDAGANAWGERAQHLGTKLEDASTVVHARINLATALARRDYAAGVAALERCITEAQAAGFVDHAGRALANRAWAALDDMRLDEAEVQIARALAYTDAFDVHQYLHYLIALRALVACHRGRWQEVIQDAGSVLRRQDHAPLTRIVALTALGRMQVRRGDSAAEATLAEGWRLAERTSQLIRMGPVCAAQAERDLLLDRHEAAATALSRVLTLADERGTPWQRGELRWLAQQVGLPVADQDVAPPWAMQLRGAWEDAATAWEELGYPYEAAVARLHAGDVPQVQAAAQIATALQARPLLARCNATLRKLGVRETPMPRGPRASTQANPAGLTQREAEVLELVAAGLTNAGIAERLYLTPKTVGHHLSAIYTKLGAANRVEAVRLAREMARDAQYGNGLGVTRDAFPMSEGERA